jgi:hypothetical protein
MNQLLLMFTTCSYPVYSTLSTKVINIDIRIVTSLWRTYDGSVAEEELMKLRGEWREQTPQCGDQPA